MSPERAKDVFSESNSFAHFQRACMFQFLSQGQRGCAASPWLPSAAPAGRVAQIMTESLAEHYLADALQTFRDYKRLSLAP